MPLTVNVGLSKKSSQNFQSEGVSINVSAELDHALLGRPENLHREIAGLYRQAEAAMESQLNHRPHRPHRPTDAVPPRNPHNGSTSPQSNGARKATASQLRALQGICKRLEVDLESESHNEFGRGSTELDIRQASVLIDLLKARLPVGKAGGR